MTFARMAGLSGLVFVVLVVINAALLGDSPLAGDSVEEVRGYLADDEGRHKAAIMLGLLLIPFAVLFFAGVVQRLRASDHVSGDGYAVAALLGAIFLAVGSALGDTLQATLFFRGGAGLSDSTLRALWDAQIIAYASTGIAITVLTLSVVIPTFFHGLWPRWHGGLGLLVAALGVVGLVGVVSARDTGDVLAGTAFIAFLVWTVLTSVLLARAPTSQEEDGMLVRTAATAQRS